MADVSETGEITTWRARNGAPPCPFKDQQEMKIVLGHLCGTLVRVNGRDCFYEPEPVYYEGDPAKGVLSPAGWQIVLDGFIKGEWLYLVRLHESTVRRYCNIS